MFSNFSCNVCLQVWLVLGNRSSCKEIRKDAFVYDRADKEHNTMASYRSSDGLWRSARMQNIYWMSSVATYVKPVCGHSRLVCNAHRRQDYGKLNVNFTSGKYRNVVVG